MKSILVLFLLALLSAAHAGEAEIRQSLQSSLSDVGEIEHVEKTPYAGLYEVVIGGRLLYVDEQGEYLFSGRVIEVKSRRDVTEDRRQQLFAIEFDKLPFELALVKVKGNGKRKMAYFSDPNCGYCKRLESELSKVTDVTLYLFLHPIFQGSGELVRNVFCAKDPIKAWDELMLNRNAPASASCKMPSGELAALARRLRVDGTPNLIFGDGVQVPGYLSADELEKRLNKSIGK